MALEDIEYLFDANLVNSIEELIEQADKELFLVSPYLDLSKQTIHKLNTQLNKNNIDFNLKVLFGKDGLDKLKTGKDYGDKLKNSLLFLMKFPNVEIRFEERLHAKFFKNDFDAIYSSLNLIDYSERKNIEFGIKVKLASKSAIWRLLNNANDSVNEKVDEAKRKLITGTQAEVNPIEKFNSYFNESEQLYKSEANLIEKNNLGAKIVSVVGVTLKEIDGSNPKNIIKDELTPIFNGKEKSQSKTVVQKNYSTEKISLNNFVKEKSIDKTTFIEKLIKEGLAINEKQVTEKGMSAGLEIKKYMGKDYISIPKNFEIK
jgi:hypothetical protein